jgi:hypothetical protein
MIAQRINRVAYAAILALCVTSWPARAAEDQLPSRAGWMCGS